MATRTSTSRTACTRCGLPAPALVLGSVCSVQVGQALGKGLFGVVGGPWGAVALRLAFAALLLLLLWRPRLPDQRSDLLLILAFGTAIAGMNLVYLAMNYLPLGVAATIQLTGPLTVSLLSSRHRRDVLWGAWAVLGIFLFTDPGSAESLPVPGVVFAAASAVSMGTYLLLSRRVGARMPGSGPLALAVAWAALLSLPAGVADSGTRLLHPYALAVGLGVAVLSAAGPYSLEFTALRRLPTRVVGVLQSLEPVVAALAGLLLLREALSVSQWAAIVCITVASSGAIAGHSAGSRKDMPKPRSD